MGLIKHADHAHGIAQLEQQQQNSSCLFKRNIVNDIDQFAKLCSKTLIGWPGK